MKRSYIKTKAVSKRSPKKQQEVILDDLFRTIVRLRDKGIDQYTLHAKGIEKPGYDAHHIFSRSHFNTRWDTQNGILVMGMHNRNIPHMEPEVFRTFLIEKWFKSERLYLDLHTRGQISAKKLDRSMMQTALFYEMTEFINSPITEFHEMKITEKQEFLKKCRRRV